MERKLHSRMLTKLAEAIPAAFQGDRGSKYRTELKQSAKYFDNFAKDQEHGSFIRLYSKSKSHDPGMRGKAVTHFGIYSGGGAGGIAAGTMGIKDPELHSDVSKHFKGTGGVQGTGGGASMLKRLENMGFNVGVAPKGGKGAIATKKGKKGGSGGTPTVAAAAKKAKGAAAKNAPKGSRPNKKATAAAAAKALEQVGGEIKDMVKNAEKIRPTRTPPTLKTKQPKAKPPKAEKPEKPTPKAKAPKAKTPKPKTPKGKKPEKEPEIIE